MLLRVLERRSRKSLEDLLYSFPAVEGSSTIRPPSDGALNQPHAQRCVTREDIANIRRVLLVDIVDYETKRLASESEGRLGGCGAGDEGQALQRE